MTIVADRLCEGPDDDQPLERTRMRRAVAVGLRIAVGLAVPTALYYLLRALGHSVYVALVVSTVLSALPSIYSLVRYRRVDGLSLYVTVMMLGGLAVSLVPGSTRFLLAREAVMTGVTGVWFLASAATSRPLAYQFTRPLLEGRLRWPDHWDQLWQVSPPFRRLWRVSSVVWGVGTLTDALVRVVLAWTVRPDLVPALGLALYVVTVVVVNVGLNVYYILIRVHDPRSPLRRGAEPCVGPVHAGPSTGVRVLRFHPVRRTVPRCRYPRCRSVP